MAANVLGEYGKKFVKSYPCTDWIARLNYVHTSMLLLLAAGGIGTYTCFISIETHVK